MKITNVTGSHLTTADKRNIKALLTNPNFLVGERYQVNKRKVYAIGHSAGTSYGVTIEETERDGFGRPITRKYRSQFEVQASWWVNHEGCGEQMSVGPFRSTNVADTFRAMCFADPAYGTVALEPDGTQMTVTEYLDYFRADLNHAKGSVPDSGWHR